MLDWMARAACRGMPLDRFIPADNPAVPIDADDATWQAGWDTEQWVPPPEVLAVCEPCPVRDRCLDWACSFDAYGYWAATSRHQRRQLRRPRQRLTCPVCGCPATAVVDVSQLCLGCGLSWRATGAPARQEAG